MSALPLACTPPAVATCSHLVSAGAPQRGASAENGEHNPEEDGSIGGGGVGLVERALLLTRRLARLARGGQVHERRHDVDEYRAENGACGGVGWGRVGSGGVGWGRVGSGGVGWGRVG